jgi:O-antigen ligase
MSTADITSSQASGRAAHQAMPAHPRLAALADRGELLFLAALLIFSPLARGAAPRWAFCISAWLALCALYCLVVKRWSLSRSPLPRTGLELPLLLFLIMAALSYLFSIYPAATLWSLGRLGVYLMVFYLGYDLTYIRRRSRQLVVLVGCLAVFELMVGVIKYNGGTLPALWAQTLPNQADFITGTYLNHNHFAGYLEMVTGLVLGFLVWRHGQGRVLASVVLPFLLMGLILSLSRGAWMATVAATLFFLLIILEMKPEIPRGRKWAAGVVVAATVALFALGVNPVMDRLQTLDRDSPAGTPASRITVWEATLDLIADKPLTGSGMGTFPWAFTRVRPAGLGLRWYEAHNDYLHIVSEMGLLVIIPLGWGLFLIFRRGLHNLRESTSTMVKAVSAGALFGIVAILVHSVTDFNLQVTANGILFSLLVGLVMGGRNLEGWYESHSRLVGRQ